MKLCKVCIMGNHDQAAQFDPEGFNPVALRAVYWTRDQLDNGPGGAARVNARWDFLGELPAGSTEDHTLYVHGSPREPTNEYVFPEDVYNHRKMEALFGLVPQATVSRGTPTFPECSPRNLRVPDAGGLQLRVPADGRQDHDQRGVGRPAARQRPAVVLRRFVDGDRIVFRRVEYPVEVVAKKIYAVPNLDNMLGDRLLAGR